MLALERGGWAVSRKPLLICNGYNCTQEAVLALRVIIIPYLHNVMYGIYFALLTHIFAALEVYCC